MVKRPQGFLLSQLPCLQTAFTQEMVITWNETILLGTTFQVGFSFSDLEASHLLAKNEKSRVSMARSGSDGEKNHFFKLVNFKVY